MTLTTNAGIKGRASSTVAVLVSSHFPCTPSPMLVLIGGVISRKGVIVMGVEIVASQWVLGDIKSSVEMS